MTAGDQIEVADRRPLDSNLFCQAEVGRCKLVGIGNPPRGEECGLGNDESVGGRGGLGVQSEEGSSFTSDLTRVSCFMLRLRGEEARWWCSSGLRSPLLCKDSE